MSVCITSVSAASLDLLFILQNLVLDAKMGKREHQEARKSEPGARKSENNLCSMKKETPVMQTEVVEDKEPIRPRNKGKRPALIPNDKHATRRGLQYRFDRSNVEVGMSSHLHTTPDPYFRPSVIGGDGGAEFSCFAETDGKTLHEIEVWAGRYCLKAISVRLTNDTTPTTFGSTKRSQWADDKVSELSYKKFTFNPGERITSLSIWSNGPFAGLRLCLRGEERKDDFTMILVQYL
ncbi:hypothetical protein R1sor_015832 [Riccia sorocarpa]|uniref:Jacalin-type lectin domain-containing protein n=1 Tax=Riccia sorocarpa TaxID=122646 RepID=A0ABD3HDA9_9MARC